MEIISSAIDRIKTEKDCSAIVRTKSGIEITMYGCITDGEVDNTSIGASFWNKKLFDSLDLKEQNDICRLVEKELSKYER